MRFERVSIQLRACFYGKENAKGANGRKAFATEPLAFPLRPLRSLRFPLLSLEVRSVV